MLLRQKSADRAQNCGSVLRIAKTNGIDFHLLRLYNKLKEIYVYRRQVYKAAILLQPSRAGCAGGFV